MDASLAYASTVYTDKVLPSTPVQTALALKTALAERQSANLAAFVQVRAAHRVRARCSFSSVCPKGPPGKGSGPGSRRGRTRLRRSLRRDADTSAVRSARVDTRGWVPRGGGGCRWLKGQLEAQNSFPPSDAVPLALTLVTLATQARAEYFSLIEAHVEALKAKGVTLSHDASAALATAIADARARATTEAHAALGKVSAAWDAFVATPSVASAMEAATPAVQAARAKAHAALTYVLSTPQYQTYVAPRVDYVASQPRVQAVVGKIRPLVVAAF